MIFSASAIMTPSGLGRLLSVTVTVTVTVAQFIPETRIARMANKRRNMVG